MRPGWQTRRRGGGRLAHIG